MGNYNSQYETYYSSLQRRKTYNGYYRTGGKNRAKTKLDAAYFTKRIMMELTGVLILFFIVIVCKVVSVPQTKTFYTYSKHVVSASFDLNAAFQKVKEIKYTDIQTYASKVVVDIKTKLEELSKASI